MGADCHACLAAWCRRKVSECFLRDSGRCATLRPDFANSISLFLDISRPHFGQLRPRRVIAPQPGQILFGRGAGASCTTQGTVTVTAPTFWVTPSDERLNSDTEGSRRTSYSLNISGNNQAALFGTTCTGLPSPAVCTVSTQVGLGTVPVQVQTQSLPIGNLRARLDGAAGNS